MHYVVSTYVICRFDLPSHTYHMTEGCFLLNKIGFMAIFSWRWLELNWNAIQCRRGVLSFYAFASRHYRTIAVFIKQALHKIHCIQGICCGRFPFPQGFPTCTLIQYHRRLNKNSFIKLSETATQLIEAWQILNVWISGWLKHLVNRSCWKCSCNLHEQLLINHWLKTVMLVFISITIPQGIKC